MSIKKQTQAGHGPPSLLGGPPPFFRIRTYISPMLRSHTQKNNILDMDREHIAKWCETSGIKPYRTAQILRWLYARGAVCFDNMTDLSKQIRHQLSEQFALSFPKKIKEEVSVDGSRKFLFGLSDENHIETVLIPEKDHYTLCISTQVGCAMGCRFCLTAKNGLVRNLTPGEITGQVLQAQREITATDGDKSRLTNIVLMGMGEPLANYDSVISAIRIITDHADGMGFSTRRVTLSTSGLVPRFSQLGKDTRIRLAISLNATQNTTRDMLMPVNKTWPLEALIDACAAYPLAPRDKITFEYILIAGVNDSPEDARRLAKLLAPVKAKINLIPFNEHRASGFKRPDESAIFSFQKILHQKNYTAIIRRSKGQDISAACGQLSAGQTVTSS